MAKLHTEAVAGAGVEILSALVDGTTADTDIAVSGLSWKKDPRFIACVHLTTKAAIATADSLLSEVVRGVTDDEGSIQLSTTDTSSDQLLLIWAQKA